MSGVVIIPSGRTWTLPPRSALRQTKTFSWSRAPITYFSVGAVSSAPTKLAGGSCSRPLASPAAAAPRLRARASVEATSGRIGLSSSSRRGSACLTSGTRDLGPLWLQEVKLPLGTMAFGGASQIGTERTEGLIALDLPAISRGG